MPARNRAIPAGTGASPDVGTPQVVKLVRMWCPCPVLSDRVAAGRSVSAVFSNQVIRATSATAPQKKWSRGCRISDVSFWSWQWQQSSQLAHPKHRSPHRKSPSSRRIPASTSKFSARAWTATAARPAPDHGLPPSGRRPENPQHSQAVPRHLRATGPVFPSRPASCAYRSPPRC